MSYKEFEINTVWYDNGHADHDIQQVLPDGKPQGNGYTHVVEYGAYEWQKTIAEAEMRQSAKLGVRLAMALNAMQVLIKEIDEERTNRNINEPDTPGMEEVRKVIDLIKDGE